MRLASIGLAVVFLAIQICCSPPLRAAAFEAAQPIHCPLQKDECERTQRSDCSGAPQFLSETPVKKVAAPAQLQPAAVIAGVPIGHAQTSIIAGWWSAPTRTIQLRI